MEKPKVLFLCTGNSVRSQMAEAFLRKYAGDRFSAFSAGLEPSRVHPLAIQVMAELGIDMSGQTSKSLQEYIGKEQFSYLITVCFQADERCPIFPGMGVRMHWGFEDPAKFSGTEQERIAKFRQVRDQIQARIQAWLEEPSPERGRGMANRGE